jgi:hypothetical protein
VPARGRGLAPLAGARPRRSPLFKPLGAKRGAGAGLVLLAGAAAHAEPADQLRAGEDGQAAGTLQFARAAGARAYVAFVRAHVADYLGSYPTVRAFRSAGRSGWLFRAQSCACPGATPLWLGVASAGTRVTWLEINGPDATAATLRTLAARAP